MSSQAPRGFDPHDLEPPPLGPGPFPVSAVALDVSGRCNLACRYCAEAMTMPPRPAMSRRTLDAAWRLLGTPGQKRHGCSVRLGSGEPLLAFPLLCRLRELIERASRGRAEDRPDVFLTTNGTLIDRARAAWLADSGWHVKISLDGPAAIQDRWRVDRGGEGTFDRVAAAVADLAQRMPSRLSVTAVLCRGTDPGEVFESVAALGVRRIELVPVAHHDPDVLPEPGDVQRYRRFVARYARRRAEPAPGNEPPALVRFENRLRRVMGYDLRRVSCGAGREFVGVAPGGDLYPCFRFIGVKRYWIGHVATGLDAAAAGAFCQGPARPYHERTPCAVCWAAPLCGGPCFACAEMFGPAGGHPPPLHCQYVLADAEAAVRLVLRLRRQNPTRLLNLLCSNLAWKETGHGPKRRAREASRALLLQLRDL